MAYYVAHPRELPLGTRARLAEEYERNRLSRQQWTNSLAAQGTAYGDAPGMAVQSPVALEPIGTGPLPLPTYGQPAKGKLTEKEKALWAHLFELDILRARHEYSAEDEKKTAELEKAVREDEKKFEREILQTKEGFAVRADRDRYAHLEDQLDKRFDFEETAAETAFERESLAAGQERKGEFEQRQLEAVQEAIEAGTHYYTPAQKQRLLEIDNWETELLQDPKWSPEESNMLLQKYHEQKKQIWLNPKERPPDERKLSLEEDFKQNVLIDQYGRHFAKTKDGDWQGMRNVDAIGKDGQEQAEIHEPTGYSREKRSDEISKADNDYHYEIDRLLKVKKAGKRKVLDQVSGELREEDADVPAYTVEEAKAEADRRFEWRFKRLGMRQPESEVPLETIPDQMGVEDWGPRLEHSGTPYPPRSAWAAEEEQCVPEASPFDLDSPYAPIPAGDPDRPGSPLMDEIRAAAGEATAQDVPLPPAPSPEAYRAYEEWRSPEEWFGDEPSLGSALPQWGAGKKAKTSPPSPEATEAEIKIYIHTLKNKVARGQALTIEEIFTANCDNSPSWKTSGKAAFPRKRAYVVFLNRIRADLFDSLTASLGRSGKVTIEEARIIANFINVSTGRGPLGKAQVAAASLATVFFAPRYVVSRFQLLAGQPVWKGNAETRSLIALEYARALTGLGVFYTILILLGDMLDDEDDRPTVELDSRSANFGKVRFGKTRLDPLAGLSQTTVFISRAAGGKTKLSSGRVVPLRGEKVPYGGSKTPDVIARFLRSKLTPWLGSAVNVVSGENLIGEPVTPGSVAANATIPLALRDIYETMKEQGVPKGAALGILSIFGLGLQTYETGAEHRLRITQRLRDGSKLTDEDKAGMDRDQLKRIRADARVTPYQAFFRSLSFAEALDVYLSANEEERKQTRGLLVHKSGRVKKITPEQRRLYKSALQKQAEK